MELRGEDIYRMKGVLSIKDFDQRFVFHVRVYCGVLCMSLYVGVVAVCRGEEACHMLLLCHSSCLCMLVVSQVCAA